MKWLLASLALVAGLHSNGIDSAAASSQDGFGLLVMAHGGTEEWNQAVEEAVEALDLDAPAEIAFGMADARTLQAAVSRLEHAGARRIGVVRLMISGESWFERTRQILGVEPGASARDATSTERPDGASSHHASSREASPHGSSPDEGADEGAGDSGHHRPELWLIETSASFAFSRQGLSEAPEMDRILLARARSLSTAPQEEDVLILAHGPGDDQENERWIAAIRDRTHLVAAELPVRRLEVMTLREDWTGKRAVAEEMIREFVERSGAEGARAIVIPFRVQGFGPYAEVLEGLVYEADGTGLLPHPAVTHWLERQARELRAATFEPPLSKLGTAR